MDLDLTSLLQHSALRPRAADLLDILFVTLLVYGVIVRLRRARSRFVLYGVWPLALLYLLARGLEMQVTLAIFRLGITVALIALVVIFQEEIRRAFERLASAGRVRWPRETPPWHATVDVVVESVTTLARQKVGALIVFRAQEPLERHLTGGYPLDGVASQPLFFSIFDTSSPGHDGAVIVEDNRLTRFGVHLPLSLSAPGVDRMGTRHTAAIGLSERSDALVVVVSEERGAISVARDGALEVLSSAQLRARLEAFFEKLYPERSVSALRHFLTSHLGTKALALVVACGAWAIFAGFQGQTMSRRFDVPIAYGNVPAGLFLDQPSPDRAAVTLRGPRGAFQRLVSADLLIAIDASRLRQGSHRVALRESNLERPQGLAVESIEPPFATVVANKALARELAVEPQTSGSLPRGLRLKALHVVPPRVPLLVRRADSERLGPVQTTPIDLSALTATTSRVVELQLPPGAHRTEATPFTVQVTVELEPVEVQRRSRD